MSKRETASTGSRRALGSRLTIAVGIVLVVDQADERAGADHDRGSCRR
jgi:hypothetical protein